MFLIIGWNRNTKDDPGQWVKNGVPFDFDYTQEQVIASGRTEKELEASARRYRRLRGMSWEEYFKLKSTTRPEGEGE
jgi:hypothetical protein